MKYVALPTIALALGGCATLTDGAYQDVSLTSNAPGARCSITQNGHLLVEASPVPATHNLPKRPGNLQVDCAAEGHEPETVVLITGKHPMAVTGVALTGVLVNVGTDAISSSWHEYQGHAYVHLRKKPAR